MRKLAFLATLFLTFQIAPAQPPTLSTFLSADTVSIGDQVTYSIEMDKDVSQEVGLPQFKDNKMTDKLEIIGTPTVDTLTVQGRRVKLRVNYTITSFDAGQYTLQGFPIVVANGNKSSDTLRTPGTNTLTVNTFEIDTTKQQIYDIKNPLATPFQWAEVWTFVKEHKTLLSAIAGGIVLVTIALYFWLRAIGRRKRRIARAIEPPHITALRALDALQHKKLLQSGQIHLYYSTLSDILRTYLEGRYTVSAMEMTTPEILDAMKPICSDKQFTQLREFLILSDLVKFAKWNPDNDQNQENFDTVHTFVEQTTPIATPATQE